VYVFPGIGLGAMVSEAREVTDQMFEAAADVLARCVSADDLEQGALYPPIAKLREVTARVAEAVVRAARDGGVGRSIADEDIAPAIASAMWTPEYPSYVAGSA
jgi:malic enzyme